MPCWCFSACRMIMILCTIEPDPILAQKDEPAPIRPMLAHGPRVGQHDRELKGVAFGAALDAPCLSGGGPGFGRAGDGNFSSHAPDRCHWRLAWRLRGLARHCRRGP